jgi:hypothetical protein
MFDRTTFLSGVATGATAVFVAWCVVSIRPKTAEPTPEQHSILYDRCLATGRSTTACDAGIRVLQWDLQQEKYRREEDAKAAQKVCVDEAKKPGSQKNLFDCFDPDQR